MSRSMSAIFGVNPSSNLHAPGSRKQTGNMSSGVEFSELAGAGLEKGQNFQPAKLMIVIACIGIVALGFTSYLGWVALHSSKVAGCGGGSIFDCDDVINSRWSRWLGIPVSFMAFGMYATMIASIAVGSMKRISIRTRNVAWSLVIAMGLSAGLAAIWFISLQIFVIKHLCTYCLAAHCCGFIISALLLWFRPLGGKTIGYLSLVSLLGFGVLVGGQLLFKPITYQVIEYDVPAENGTEVESFEFLPPVDPADTEQATNQTRPTMPINVFAATLRQAVLSMIQPSQLIRSQISIVTLQENESTTQNPVTNQSASSDTTPATTDTAVAKPKERRFVSMSGGSLKLDVAQWPLAGKQNAKYIFVEMYDYTCDHCRRTHAAISAAKTALNGDVAVLALAIPMNTNCNNAITQTGPRMAETCEISKLAVALWRVDPSKFDEFHEYLMTTPAVVTYAEAIGKAHQLVDATKLDEMVASNTPSQYIAQHVELFKKVGTGTVPKLLFPATSIIGEFTSPEALVDVIKTQIK